MPRLPTPGLDSGVWGDILNEFLRVEHNDDGTLKTTFLPEDQKGQFNGVAELDGSGKVPLSQLPSSVFVQDASTTDKGIIKLAGDLDNTADIPRVANGAITNAKVSGTAAIDQSKLNLAITDSEIASGANIAQSKIAGLSTDMANKVDVTGDTMTGALTINSTASTTPGSGTSQLTITPASSVSATSLLYFNTDRPWGFAQNATGAGTALDLRAYSSDKYFDIYANGGSTRALSVYASTTTASNAVGIYMQPQPGNGALQLGSTATGGLVWNNVADATTNYERVAGKWISSAFHLVHEVGGSGTLRSVNISTWATAGAGTPGRTFTVSPSVPFFNFNWGATGLVGNMIATSSSTLSGSSGTQTVLSLSPTLNQSSTAAFKILEINPSISLIGSGTNYLIDTQYGSSPRFQVFSSATATNNTLISAPNGAGDVALAIQNNATTANETVSILFYTTTNLTTPFGRIRTTRVDGATSRMSLGPVTSSTVSNHIQMYGDTGLMSLGAGATPANGLVTIGANTTTAAGGIYFGTDTNLYRSATNTLKTDDAFESASSIRGVNRYYLTNSGSNFPGLEAYADTDSGFVYHYFYRKRTTGGTTQANDVLGAFGFRGHDGTNYINGDGARIQAAAAENFTSSAYSAHIDIVNNNVGTASSVTTWRFAAGGVLQSRVTGTTGGLSFGSGGTQDVNLYRSAANELKTDDAFVIGSDRLNIATTKTPASAAAAGTTGDIAWDGDYIYVCVATNTWKRTNLTSW